MESEREINGRFSFDSRVGLRLVFPNEEAETNNKTCDLFAWYKNTSRELLKILSFLRQGCLGVRVCSHFFKVSLVVLL